MKYRWQKSNTIYPKCIYEDFHHGDMTRLRTNAVIERRSMHQKIAIIDDAIAWEGSLNILSHKDTEEHMRRFEGPSTIEEIIRNLELDEDMPSGNQTEEKCPQRDGYLVVRAKFGRKFLGCSNYAKKKCRYTKPL